MTEEEREGGEGVIEASSAQSSTLCLKKSAPLLLFPSVFFETFLLSSPPFSSLLSTSVLKGGACV